MHVNFQIQFTIHILPNLKSTIGIVVKECEYLHHFCLSYFCSKLVPEVKREKEISSFFFYIFIFIQFGRKEHLGSVIYISAEALGASVN
jgi:hypothetical protein